MSCQKTRTKQAHWPLQWRNDWNGSTKWLICRRSWSWWTHTGLTFPISHTLPISKCAAHVRPGNRHTMFLCICCLHAQPSRQWILCGPWSWFFRHHSQLSQVQHEPIKTDWFKICFIKCWFLHCKLGRTGKLHNLDEVDICSLQIFFIFKIVCIQILWTPNISISDYWWLYIFGFAFIFAHFILWGALTDP